MHTLRAAPLLLVVACGGGPTSECANPNNYRVLALVDGNADEHRDARILCTSWSPGCDAASATPGTTPTDQAYDCHCLGYALTAEGFRIDFPPSEVGDVIPLQQGEMTITKKVDVLTSCAQGDYYTDYAGTFEGTFGGHTYQRGVFYALEQK
jgi:hypothetical protein